MGRCVKYFDEFDWPHRFQKKLFNAGLDCLSDGGVVGVSADQDHRDSDFGIPQPLKELQPIHSREPQIGEHTSV